MAGSDPSKRVGKWSALKANQFSNSDEHVHDEREAGGKQKIAEARSRMENYLESTFASGSMPCSIFAMRSRWCMTAFTMAIEIPPATATMATTKGSTSGCSSECNHCDGSSFAIERKVMIHRLASKWFAIRYEHQLFAEWPAILVSHAAARG
jgi:hypothetical protein